MEEAVEGGMHNVLSNNTGFDTGSGFLALIK